MGVSTINKSSPQAKVEGTKERHDTKGSTKGTENAAKLHGMAVILLDNGTKKATSKKDTAMKLDKKRKGEKLTNAEIKEMNDTLASYSANFKKTSQKLTTQQTFSKSDAEDYLSNLKGFNVLLIAMVAMLNNQHGSQNEISSLSDLSTNLNDAVTSWQKTSAFWLQAYYVAGYPSSEEGGFNPDCTPENVNTFNKGGEEYKYEGVIGTQVDIAQAMGVWNKLSTTNSAAAQRLATTAGLPGQLTQSINSQIQTGMSAMQAIQQANSSMLQTVNQWS